MTFRLTEGEPEPLGATLTGAGLNIAVFSAHAERIELCLFDGKGENEIGRLTLPARTGDVFHGHVAGVSAGQRYGLRAHGPYTPEQGHRFNPHKLLLDPHASLIDRPFVLHDSMYGYRRDDPALDLSFDPTDSAPFMPKAIACAPQGTSRIDRPGTPWHRTVLYEMHVRGFSMLNPAVPAPLRGTFAGLAHPASISHLTRLGVTAVEVLPVVAGIDERHLAPLGLTNYWGYNPVAWCAPAPHLAPGGWAEIRDAVSRLHEAGIEVIVDVVLNHSGEGDELGPTISLRGLDNASYYRLQPGHERAYVNDAGCGNILACDRAPVVRLAMDALRIWAFEAGIDGFRFDLAATLGRLPGGFDPEAPLLAAIAQDPVLRDLKLIAEPWDIGPGGYQVGRFSGCFAEWNDRYRDDVRRFWRDDTHMLGALATRLSGSSDLFAGKRRPSRGINFITAHDGFTLADLVSHTAKHNQANGENNRDGTDANLGWNHGIEGTSKDAAVMASRLRDQRSLMATLLLSRGTPMLAMGSETGHSQGGNNNAYAQDSRVSWLDWEQAEHGLTGFAARLIAFRQAHPALTQDRFLTGAPVDGSGQPDIVWAGADGVPLSEAGWNAAAGQTLVATFSAVCDDILDRVLVVIHRGGEPCQVTLPASRDGHVWRRDIDTAVSEDRTPENFAGEEQHEVAARSVMVFCEVAQPGRARRGVDAGVLGQLAKAAGIAPEWWDVSGGRTMVSDGTRQALLAAMSLDAASTWQARASLFRLAEQHDRRCVPLAACGWEGECIRLYLPDAPVQAALVLRLGDGQVLTWPLSALGPEPFEATARDGRRYRGVTVTLPQQPPGRHQLWLDRFPDMACHLTVAPRRCWLPPGLAAGNRRFGIAAQLYGLRGGETDRGIGDFATLATFARAAASRGAALVGLNPMHALFAGDRERASPYSPSDRRFLDPVYLDLAAPALTENAPKARALMDADRSAIAALSARDMVDYPAVWRYKRAVLDAAFAAFAARRVIEPAGAEAAAFDAFCAAGGRALHDFAVFEAIAETRAGAPWFDWPTAFRDPRSPAVAAFAEAHMPQVDFHLFLQWHCERQLADAAAAARAAGLDLGFYRDLAVGAAPDGAEIWAGAGDFAHGVSVGAPPDPFSATGQVWGLPPLNPLSLAARGLAPFAGLLAANMRHAGALRVDHVMALQRLFWVPEGAAGIEGAYVAYPLEQMLAQVALESTRARCLVVGEDLGTVPEGFRERLAASDILSYRVLLFERDGQHFRPPATYPAGAVACVATHDLPTFTGWQRGADLSEAAALGLLPAATLPQARADRAADRAAVAAMAGADADVAEPDLTRAAHAAIAGSPCLLALVQADDLAGAVDGVNLPGTDRERPNWRRRLPVDVQELFETEAAQALLATMVQRGS